MRRKWSTSAGPTNRHRVRQHVAPGLRVPRANTRPPWPNGGGRLRRRTHEPGRNGGERTSDVSIGTLVSGSLLRRAGHTAGARPLLPRRRGQVPGEQPVVVLSHAFWQRRFNGDPDILKKPLRLNNRDVLGRRRRRSRVPGTHVIGTDVWVPMAMVAVAARQQHRDADRACAASGTWRIGRLEARRDDGTGARPSSTR